MVKQIEGASLGRVDKIQNGDLRLDGNGDFVSETETLSADQNSESISRVFGEDSLNTSETPVGNEAVANPSVDSQGEQVVEPMDLVKLYESSIVENPDAVFDTQSQIRIAEDALVSVESSIADIRAQIEQKKADLARIRGELGDTAVAEVDNTLPEEHRLEQLLEQQEALVAQKEEAEELEELQEAMDEMDKLPPEIKIFILQNGTMPDGEPVKTKNGKEINKEVAMDLAKSLENGVKRLTKAVLKTVLAVVKGVLKGVFAGIKAAVQK